MSGERMEAILKEITEIIVREYQPQRIILFGSYAYGTPDADSDIDLLIIKDTEETPEQRWFVVKKLLNHIHRQVAVSPLVYTPREIDERLAINDLFLDEILEKGKRLYG
ncbi:MAG: nucleotidyltransferase domain-containing protein [Anaerolineae bacterium]|jgi:predicted nucleotidyltransferase|nr:nucleotidyltransferase domain-containing protein [Anaerolineae bacterium]